MSQDPDERKPPSSTGRKVRYAPKAPAPSRNRRPKLTAPETESTNEEAETQAQQLIRQFNEANARQRHKPEKKSSVQVAFGPADTSSISIRTFGVQRDGNGAKGSDARVKDSTSDDRKFVTFSPSTAREEGIDVHSSDASTEKIEEAYGEPWNYFDSYYPTTLPWRMPFSGDPELLDEAEFGEAARNLEYDENTINPASDLGLLEESLKERMLFFQFPSSLPLVKASASTKGKEKAESSKALGRADGSKKGCSLEELPVGHVGKLLVYKSGAVKLKLGDTMFDVSPGSDISFAQNAAAINTKDETCCNLGQLDKRAVVTPDIGGVLDNVINLN